MHFRAAAQTAIDALAGSPHLLPDYLLDRVEDLDPDALKELGFSNVIFDYDNTLARWRKPDLPPPVADLILRLLQAGIGVAVASNGFAGRFGRLADAWSGSLRFVGGCGKPDPGRVRQIMEEAGWDPQATILVGDNTLTDVAAGRAAGCATALVRPLSWFEAPPTKLWRVLERIHRLRRPEWATIPRLGPERIRPRPALGLSGLALMLALAVLFLTPLIRSAAPGSESSSYQLGMAHAFAKGWPDTKSPEPERSLLIMAILAPLPDHAAPPPALAGAFLAILLVGIAGCPFALLRGAPLWAAAGALPILFAPATIAAAGEISPSALELLCAASALTIAVSPLSAAGLFFIAVLNGLSGMALAPVFLIRSPARLRIAVARALALAGLLAAACWVLALSRSPASSPAWDYSLGEGASFFSSPGGLGGLTVVERFVLLEQGLRRGLFGRAEGLGKLPLTVMAVVCALPSLARRSPGAAVYIAARAALAVMLPGLFHREMLTVVFIPFIVLSMSAVFSRLLGGRGPVVFSVLLAAIILTHAPAVRRQVVSARQAYRANTELTALARAARSLPEESLIATSEPARVFLISGRGTEARRADGGGFATHAIAPRLDPIAGECLATRSLMLCPR
ncbi:MAG: HAD hydrolase-like protein [Candidatus Eisenbacteria bacterium]|nr:HAD hydrolase-like protein [Candidatus Eisenbacteria bacterium]